MTGCQCNASSLLPMITSDLLQHNPVLPASITNANCSISTQTYLITAQVLLHCNLQYVFAPKSWDIYWNHTNTLTDFKLCDNFWPIRPSHLNYSICAHIKSKDIFYDSIFYQIKKHQRVLWNAIQTFHLEQRIECLWCHCWHITLLSRRLTGIINKILINYE